ncbi:YqjF family protein [Natronorarus salvus]|uniref:YqjF family protein n=1 Tax=Natronorarus salvus TaxID=3117733 RepID=UPI002F265C4B
MAPVVSLRVRDVVFCHWPVDTDQVRRRLPNGLEPATYDDSAWVSVVALAVDGVRPFGVPVGGRSFAQLNLRTYTSGGREEGVYFLALATGDPLSAVPGRYLFGLPYAHADLSHTAGDGDVTVRCRADDRTLFSGRFECGGTPYRAEEGSLDAFLVERYRYVADTRFGRLVEGEIDHHPWELLPAEAVGEVDADGLFRREGLSPPGTDPRCACARSLRIRVERPQSLSR